MYKLINKLQIEILISIKTTNGVKPGHIRLVSPRCVTGTVESPWLELSEQEHSTFIVIISKGKKSTLSVTDTSFI